MPYKDPDKRRAWERQRSKERATDPKRREQEAERQRRITARTAKPARFVSVDGEDLDRRFSMLAASTGDSLNTPGRDITMGEACSMLLRIVSREREPGSKLVLTGYSINYDIQRLLRTLPLTKIAAALDRQVVEVCDGDQRYLIRYLPRKCLEVFQRGGTATRLYDVASFFQQAFVSTCKQWIPGHTADIEFMATWKAKRGGFREEDRQEIGRYNDTENRCLDEVMSRLYAAFSRYGVRPPTHPWGPGAVADVALRAFGMQKYHSQGKEYPEEVKQMIGRAFFGGRAQVLQVGEFARAYDYDLHSAYPAAIVRTLASATGEWAEDSDLTRIHDGALYSVRWNTPLENPLTPLPHRGAAGRISYPHAGEGVYWGIEVRAAVEAFGWECIEIRKGWRFFPDNTDCWKWYQGLADARVMLKEKGEKDLERVAKLVLNSVYGKTAQTKPGPGRWTSLLWAGMITAFCRARVLELASQNPHAVIFAATDGLMTTEPLEVSDNKRLGDWGRGGEGSLFVVQPGVYLFGDKSRTRGFSGADWEEMRRQWREVGTVTYDHAHSRFVTLQEGLDRGDPSIMAEWEETTTTYRSPITVEPGTINARVPPAPVPDYPSLSSAKVADPTDKIPRGYEYRWKAAIVILGKPQARAILNEQGIDAVLKAAEVAERG